MDNPTFIEAFNLAFELIVKWVFFSASLLLFIGSVVFMVCVWKAISGGTEHLYYERCW